MKIAKLRKREEEKKVDMSESYSMKSMIKILFVLLLVFGVFYLITFFVVSAPEPEDNNSVVVLDSTKITLSQLLNRKESDYYVIATKASLYQSSYVETNYVEFYNNYINEYKQKENSLAFYYVDLDDALNKKYLSEELNITDEISELKLNDETLFKITNGKIEKTYVGKDEILDLLSNL